MEFSANEIYVIGVVVMVVVQLVIWGLGVINVKVAKGAIPKAGGRMITAFVFLASLGLGLVWAKQSFPAFPPIPDLSGSDPQVILSWLFDDALAWVWSLGAALSAIMGVAMAVYNVIGKAVFEKLGITSKGLFLSKGGHV